ncbi:alpha/beta fold hydrolase [Hoyosella altamirensis]|uniref:Pimeloyl-ACP methyl ester carboxylesterase n=1 Tax=Hoyosella altamirensis TaxID=616997 RepID=A0A839RV88_9ACTN|nr:alpha/beta hydrolase [Hoyosella altamirensis]MBB3039701.1 pimeloyl-ACP methyl ester carboxylesterase [Hoyosella altamirensis]
MTANLTEVHTIERGKGDDLVLLLHGFSDNADTWNKVMPQFAAQARVVALDFPGFGRSRFWPSPLFDTYEEIVTSVIERRGGPGRVSLVGNSMGAVVSLLVASRRPDLVDRVVLADMPGIAGIPALWRHALSRRSELIVGQVVRAVPTPASRHALAVLYSLAATRMRVLSRLDRNAYAEPYVDDAAILALLTRGRDVIRELSDIPVADLVRDLQVPNLLVWGRNDLLTPSRTVRSLQQGEHSRIEVIDRCGHCPQQDRPKKFVSIVQPFLAGS